MRETNHRFTPGGEKKKKKTDPIAVWPDPTYVLPETHYTTTNHRTRQPPMSGQQN